MSQEIIVQRTLRVIIVEDDEGLRTVLVKILSSLGHDVRGVGDGTSLDAAMADYPADVVVLDLNLPGEDGVHIAQRLRATNRCGIIMTTSRALVDQRLEGFSSGADLYFVKPIEPMELHAALLNLGRRLTPSDSSWRFDPLHSVLTTPRNISINLTSQECIVLKLLVAAPGQTVPRAEIFSALGHPDDEYGRKRLETLLSRLRSKAHSHDPGSELPLRARHSIGYAFLGNMQE